MRTTPTLAAAAVVSLALLGACSKPADAPAPTTATAATPDPAASVSPPAGSAEVTGSGGGAISPPAANGAVNIDANKANSNLAAASNSFTMAQARHHIERAGFSDVTGLAKTPDGLWIGQAMKDGKPVTVSVDFKGAVSAK